MVELKNPHVHLRLRCSGQPSVATLRVACSMMGEPASADSDGAEESYKGRLKQLVATGEVPKARKGFAIYTASQPSKDLKVVARRWKALPPAEKSVYDKQSTEELRAQQRAMSEHGLTPKVNPKSARTQEAGGAACPLVPGDPILVSSSSRQRVDPSLRVETACPLPPEAQAACPPQGAQAACPLPDARGTKRPRADEGVEAVEMPVRNMRRLAQLSVHCDEDTTLKLGAFKAVCQAQVGTGAYGTCLMVTCRSGRRYVAKFMEERREAEREVQFYKYLARRGCDHHPAFLRMVSHYVGAPFSWIILPFVRGGTLSANVARYGTLAEHAWCIAEQLRYALRYLHSAQVLHLDVKPSNVMWDDEIRHTYVLDFSLSEAWPTAKTELNRHYCTAWYRAPEMWTPLPASVALLRPGLDSWSMGCTLYELGGASPLFAEVQANENGPWDLVRWRSRALEVLGGPDWQRRVPAAIREPVRRMLDPSDLVQREAVLQDPLVEQWSSE